MEMDTLTFPRYTITQHSLFLPRFYHSSAQTHALPHSSSSTLNFCFLIFLSAKNYFLQKYKLTFKKVTFIRKTPILIALFFLLISTLLVVCKNNDYFTQSTDK